MIGFVFGVSWVGRERMSRRNEQAGRMKGKRGDDDDDDDGGGGGGSEGDE